MPRETLLRFLEVLMPSQSLATQATATPTATTITSNETAQSMNGTTNDKCSASAAVQLLNQPAQPSIGIGLDSCVIPLRHSGLNLIQTTDFFYPLIEDPYIMGKIACANVLSDLYAMGVTECDNMLMLLSVSTKMTDKEIDLTTPRMIQGFKDCASEAGCTVNGGQTVKNPWIIIGGVATSICTMNEFISPENAMVSDVLVLTKPLGTQVSILNNI